EALHALKALSDMQAQNILLEPRIRSELGGLLRPPDAGYRGAEYDFISIQQREVAEGAGLEFTLATRRARDEVRGVMPQSKLVNELVCAGASAANDDPQIGRTLFKLLVPLEIEPFLCGSASMLVQLDTKTAALPWELLDTQGNEFEKRDDTRPWAVRTRLLRKLRTADYREQPQDAGREASVLVIGEPLCDNEKYPPLPGAAAEARAVAEVLGVKPILNERALTIVNAVLDHSYRILHVAGHGDVIDGIGGVVLSNGTMFGPREVKAMRRVPELAFINCCHLGRFDTRPLERINRLNDLPGALPGFAANVAEQLISIGVRCVVAAGWAVDDRPAELFARRFYAALMDGRPFVEAVGKAREAIWREHPHSNTWAAYQCYGDPYWTYVGAAGGVEAVRPLPEISAAESLVLHLDAARVAHSYGDRATERVRADVEQLEAGYAAVWGTRGDVAAAFGAVYAELGDFARAMDWYSRALSAEDAAVTLRALEQLGNVRARYGAKLADREQGRKEINAAIELLGRVAAMAPTVERESLLGSAFNRLANIEPTAGAKRAALGQALEHYGKAEKIARETGAPNLFYPAMQRMSIALVLNADAANPAVIDPADIGAARESLQKQNAESADFWSVVGLTELRIYEALASRQLAPALNSIVADIKDLMARASSRRMWDSVA
ncbi:MAG TPA: CHAT domain-containing protein, partial [Burkholderiaceae bacterium]|nr:CHAT domain-containing protein [Burkholderiaceae bacterium]